MGRMVSVGPGAESVVVRGFVVAGIVARGQVALVGCGAQINLASGAQLAVTRLQV